MHLFESVTKKDKYSNIFFWIMISNIYVIFTLDSWHCRTLCGPARNVRVRRRRPSTMLRLVTSTLMRTSTTRNRFRLNWRKSTATFSFSNRMPSHFLALRTGQCWISLIERSMPEPAYSIQAKVSLWQISTVVVPTVFKAGLRSTVVSDSFHR